MTFESGELESTSAATTPTAKQPRPPNPSTDSGIIPQISPTDDAGNIPDSALYDIFTLTPVAALNLLCNSIEALILFTGDVPPTPPVTHPNTPDVRLVRSEREQRRESPRPFTPPSSVGSDDLDGVTFKKALIGSPESCPSEKITIIGAGAEVSSVQTGALVRKFYSKNPPPIPLRDYLLRLHRYCPMSTAVYLATSLYIHRLAVEEKVLPVTSRNVHRLMLGSLRVSMKALEDLSYPHQRFARVGGVSENELGRLEVTFCFLTNFTLKVDAEMLQQHAMALRDSASLHSLPTEFQLKMPSFREKRVSPARGVSPTAVATDA
ncbi:MAG: hypothetical protein M1819_004279 [Sarea resinae]|nr:MAG: hypothetical protein M1819_004279 [Sarea resinae]